VFAAATVPGSLQVRALDDAVAAEVVALLDFAVQIVSLVFQLFVVRFYLGYSSKQPRGYQVSCQL